MVEKYYTPKQVAEILQVHPYTVLKWIREGRLPALKFGRVYRATESELTKFLGSTRSHQGQISIEDHKASEDRKSAETSIMHDETHEIREVHNKEIDGKKIESRKKEIEFSEKGLKSEQFYILEPPSRT